MTIDSVLARADLSLAEIPALKPFHDRLAEAVNSQVILYTDRSLADPIIAKTAHAMLRFAPQKVLAICDNEHAGERLDSVCSQFGDLDVPIIDERQALALAGSVVIGFAPVGGALSAGQRGFLAAATGRGMYVVNGLHDLLPETPKTINLRAFDSGSRWIASGVALRSTRVLTVGTSYSIGKMTTTALVSEALNNQGFSATWVATGQTGMLLRGEGSCIDAIPLDWASGHIEHWVAKADAEADFVIVEGQGSLSHPGLSIGVPVLMHVSRPQQMVMCHRLGQVSMGAFPEPLPSVEHSVEAHNYLARSLGVKSKVTAISLDSSRVSASEYHDERDRLQAVTGVPCCDPIRESSQPLIDAIRSHASAPE